MEAKAPNQGTLAARRSQPASPLCVPQAIQPIKAAIDASGPGRDRALHQA
jgi:hypothetical protein